MPRLDTDFGEPHLDDLLADPIVQLLMRRDGVDRQEVEEMVGNLNLCGVRLRLTLTDQLTLPREAVQAGRA